MVWWWPFLGGHHTIQLQPFLPYTQIRLPKILTGQDFGCQISLNIVDWVSEVDELDEGNMWKMTFGKTGPLVKDDLRWKTTFGGRQSLVEDNLCRETTFIGRWPLLEDDRGQNTTFVGRRPSVTAQLSQNRNCYQMSQLETEFAIVEKYMQHCTCTRLQKKRHF